MHSCGHKVALWRVTRVCNVLFGDLIISTLLLCKSPVNAQGPDHLSLVLTVRIGREQDHGQLLGIVRRMGEKRGGRKLFLIVSVTATSGSLECELQDGM